jgi:hypothetical protein
MGLVIDIDHVFWPRRNIRVLPCHLESTLNEDVTRHIFFNFNSSLEPAECEVQTIVCFVFSHPAHSEIMDAIVLGEFKLVVELNWFPTWSRVN